MCIYKCVCMITERSRGYLKMWFYCLIPFNRRLLIINYYHPKWLNINIPNIKSKNVRSYLRLEIIFNWCRQHAINIKRNYFEIYNRGPRVEFRKVNKIQEHAFKRRFTIVLVIFKLVLPPNWNFSTLTDLYYGQFKRYV